MTDALFIAGVACALVGAWLLGPGWGMLGTGCVLAGAAVVVKNIRRTK